jgi:hypothetical protein
MNSVLTILCPSACLPEDVKKYGIIGDVMAVNRVILDCHVPIKYAVSFHHDILDGLMLLRKQHRRNTEDVERWTYHGHKYDHPKAKFYIDDMPINTSGLLALCIASKLGYKEIRVLGMAADNTGHYYDIIQGKSKTMDYATYFPFDNKQWLDRFKTWTNVKVASGNLLKIFPPIND